MRVRGVGVEKTFFGGLAHDADLIDEIQKFAKENGVQSAVFSVIGAVKCVTLSFYDQERREYEDRDFKEPLEISSCFGNVAEKDGLLSVHAHGCFSRRDGSTVGGHIKSAKIFAGEFFAWELDEKLVRKFDETTGLYLLSMY